jgi:metal-responsive CopG/Arc/MetJ family transcriptional regulator
MAYGTRPTQMRLTQDDKDWLDDIAEREGYANRTDTVRGLITMYYEAQNEMIAIMKKRFTENSSVAT